MQVDDAGAIRPNSVLMDNTTLFTCLPMASEPVRRECYWATKEWADDLIDRGMSNLVESLILHEAVYVDGERGYHAPVVEEISELFPGLLRGVGIGADREQVLRRLSEAMSGGEELDRGLYSIAFHASRSRRTGEPLHLSHIYGFLHEEMQRAGLPGYAPEPGRTDPMVFRTFFYLALAARTGLPYTPYSLRNPILLALSERGLTHLVGGALGTRAGNTTRRSRRRSCGPSTIKCAAPSPTGSRKGPSACPPCRCPASGRSSGSGRSIRRPSLNKSSSCESEPRRIASTSVSCQPPTSRVICCCCAGSRNSSPTSWRGWVRPCAYRGWNGSVSSCP